MNLLDIAPTPTPVSNGISGPELTIAIVGVAIVVIVAIVAVVMSKGKNGK